MPVATEGYVDAKAAQAIATSEANVEKAITVSSDGLSRSPSERWGSAHPSPRSS